MAWINGLERKRFNEEQKRLAEQYRAAGMTEEQIEQMYSDGKSYDIGYQDNPAVAGY